MPPDYQKATIMLMSDSGSSTLAETSDAPVRAGNCRWKETLKYENSFPTSGSKKPHFVKFTVTQVFYRIRILMVESRTEVL